MVHSEIKKVGVVGCGLMGSGIAEVCARSGVKVLVREIDADAVERGQKRIVTSLDRATHSGKLSEEAREIALQNLSFTTDFADFADRELVIEAAIEDQELKTKIFQELDRYVSDENAIFATNTSSIPVMKLGIATSRPSHVVGMHFFNPVTVLRLVDLAQQMTRIIDSKKLLNQVEMGYQQPSTCQRCSDLIPMTRCQTAKLVDVELLLTVWRTCKIFTPTLISPKSPLR